MVCFSEVEYKKRSVANCHFGVPSKFPPIFVPYVVNDNNIVKVFWHENVESLRIKDPDEVGYILVGFFFS